MTASTATISTTAGHSLTRLGVTAVITAAVVACLPLGFAAISLKGERGGRSTAPISLASASGGSPIERFRSTAAAELAGNAPMHTLVKRSTAPLSLW